jgi:hypothetical protein
LWTTTWSRLPGIWALRRDFAVGSAGFPVAGLGVFGAENEPSRPRAVAADAAFREALTWQNRGTLATAADGLLKDAGKPSRRRHIASWACDHGMPRRICVRMPGEPDELVAVSEMLPRPEECWLELDGERYTSELRLVAVDLTRRGPAKIDVE